MERMNYKKEQAKKHSVTYDFAGKSHFFTVKSGNSGEEHSVALQVSCDCAFMGSRGIARKETCSHILAVLQHIISIGGIDASQLVLQRMRNECLRLVKESNRKLNIIRWGENESEPHRVKKVEICTALEKEGKHYVTEAIFKTGGRADILVLDDFTVIEIAASESEDSLQEKAKKYPPGIKLEVIRV